MRRMVIVAISVLALVGCNGKPPPPGPGLIGWTGHLVAHDTHKRRAFVDGDVRLTTTETRTEIVEIWLDPSSSSDPASWRNIPIRERRSFTKNFAGEGYVDGQFYSRPEEGIVGTFRFHQFVGGFVATRSTP